VRVSRATPLRPNSTPVTFAAVSVSAKNNAPMMTPIMGVVALKMAE